MQKINNYLHIKNVCKSYGNIEVLRSISLSIAKGEFVCFLGPSGCGKTTLLRIIAGLEELNNGEIYINETNITQFPPSKRNLGMVFQSYSLFPNMNAFQNIAFGLKPKGFNKEEIKTKVSEILNLVGLNHLSDKYPNEMSGGQQQRISLARAIVLQPNILLLDEPLSALDAKVREHLRKEIKKIHKKLNITTIMVTHDQEEALTMADKIVVINGGEIMQIGTPEEIYNSPSNRFVADFIGKINFFEFDNGQSFSIRPEDLEYSKTYIDGFSKSVIEEIEFRGAYYRLILKYNDQEIILDLTSKTARKLKLCLGDELFIQQESQEH